MKTNAPSNHDAEDPRPAASGSRCGILGSPSSGGTCPSGPNAFPAFDIHQQIGARRGYKPRNQSSLAPAPAAGPPRPAWPHPPPRRESPWHEDSAQTPVRNGIAVAPRELPGKRIAAGPLTDNRPCVREDKPKPEIRSPKSESMTKFPMAQGPNITPTSWSRWDLGPLGHLVIGI